MQTKLSPKFKLRETLHANSFKKLGVNNIIFFPMLQSTDTNNDKSIMIYNRIYNSQTILTKTKSRFIQEKKKKKNILANQISNRINVVIKSTVRQTNISKTYQRY